MIQKILIADDSRITRSIMKSIISQQKPGLEILEAENGRQAVECFSEYHPDVVLIDLTMPEMDGLEAVDKMIQIDRNAKIAVISADIQSGTRDEVKRLGVKYFVPKPINKNILIDLVKELESEN